MDRSSKSKGAIMKSLLVEFVLSFYVAPFIAIAFAKAGRSTPTVD
jgi:hypothetical protein